MFLFQCIQLVISADQFEFYLSFVQRATGPKSHRAKGQTKLSLYIYRDVIE
jgi:hypothetical protein